MCMKSNILAHAALELLKAGVQVFEHVLLWPNRPQKLLLPERPLGEALEHVTSPSNLYACLGYS